MHIVHSQVYSHPPHSSLHTSPTRPQAATRIVSPFLSLYLYEASLASPGALPPGTLPFLFAGALAVAAAPAPLLLRAVSRLK